MCAQDVVFQITGEMGLQEYVTIVEHCGKRIINMGMYMITALEIQFITDVLVELAAIADPSEYLTTEVTQAKEMLISLKQDSNEITLIKEDLQ